MAPTFAPFVPQDGGYRCEFQMYLQQPELVLPPGLQCKICVGPKPMQLNCVGGMVPRHNDAGTGSGTGDGSGQSQSVFVTTNFFQNSFSFGYPEDTVFQLDFQPTQSNFSNKVWFLHIVGAVTNVACVPGGSGNAAINVQIQVSFNNSGSLLNPWCASISFLEFGLLHFCGPPPDLGTGSGTAVTSCGDTGYMDRGNSYGPCRSSQPPIPPAIIRAEQDTTLRPYGMNLYGDHLDSTALSSPSSVGDGGGDTFQSDNLVYANIRWDAP